MDFSREIREAYVRLLAGLDVYADDVPERHCDTGSACWVAKVRTLSREEMAGRVLRTTRSLMLCDKASGGPIAHMVGALPVVAEAFIVGASENALRAMLMLLLAVEGDPGGAFAAGRTELLDALSDADAAACAAFARAMVERKVYTKMCVNAITFLPLAADVRAEHARQLVDAALRLWEQTYHMATVAEHGHGEDGVVAAAAEGGIDADEHGLDALL